jgi:lipopolysaccharide/colanic/teichoic acid biosynthesis glycosyltransferase
VIAHTRAEEIASAVRECHRRGGRVNLMTLTMRHTSRDNLSELWDGLSSGWSACGARPWTGQKARTAIRNGHTMNMSRVVGDAERFGSLV